MTEIERLLSPLDALAAARRLRERLPSRKHIFMDSDHSNRGNGKRAVMIAGVRYASMRKASEAHKRSCACIAKWLELGKATYAED